MRSALAGDLLDALGMQAAVLDAHGTIVAVNGTWKHFASVNQGDRSTYYVGANYLDVCEAAARREGSAGAQAVLDGIHSVLRGEQERCTIEYPCDSPTQRRCFVAHVARFQHEGATYVGVVHEEITARKQAEEKLQEAEATLRKALEALPIGVWVMDREGRIVHGNSAGKRIWAGALYVGPEQFGEYKGWWLGSGQRIAADEWAATRAIRKGETSIDEEIRIECFDGTSKIILNSAVPLRDAVGAISGAIIVNQDISRRKAAEEQLRRATATVDAMNRELQEVLAREQANARTDELTGVSNRRRFFELAEQMFAAARRSHAPFSLFLFDVDDFKRCNDRFGHQVGDAVLKCVADIAREHTRGADLLARYGGEEFVVALPETDVEGAMTVAEHIRQGIASARRCVADLEIGVTISGGVAVMQAEDDTLDRLIKRADQALYAAKAAGRNRVRRHAAERSG